MTVLNEKEIPARQAEHPELTYVDTGARGRRRLLLVAAITTLLIGFGSVAGGIAGAVYTWGQAAEQNITTPDDASIPGAAVRGPLTMKAQADIIEEHTLNRTDGLYYAEMPRQVEQVDENGDVVLDESGEPVMVSNTSRELWLTATTLTTSLNLGILAYGLAALAVVVGLALVTSGLVFLGLRKSAYALA